MCFTSRLFGGISWHWTGGIAVDATTHEIYVTQGESSQTIEILAPA
ncbi:hypothetical protein KHQ06_36460 [Nocardia tengchongensis]|uniref:Uncharacterized protein n=1 Tax=Nocardia tengchongensis TaxID=2055889 RepID=A0ABX8CN68_9NOCA|nr:hypothetical protein [Nocardia tengchongensis]QVI21393.1 hypothetical protein KHQ06_36460 [Nocardia tengchongensis]